MLDEQARRKPTFRDGSKIRLADGQFWSFSGDGEGTDPEYRTTLLAVLESGDRPERLRAELALAILLLSRNYALQGDDYRELLGFRPGDPGLGEMQLAVHDLAVDLARGLRSGIERGLDPFPPVLHTWGFLVPSGMDNAHAPGNDGYRLWV